MPPTSPSGRRRRWRRGNEERATEMAEKSEKRCLRCGYSSPDDALFCPACGNSLKAAGRDALIGTTIADRYLLQEKVGEGGSGTIYRAEHTMLRKKVAVKLLHAELSADE